MEAAKTSGPRPPQRIMKKPTSSCRSAQHEGEWAGQDQVEPPGPQDQEPQRTAEDREPAALVPRVKIAAHRLLGLLR